MKKDKIRESLYNFKPLYWETSNNLLNFFLPVFFSNIFICLPFYKQEMGIPIRHLVCASNSNNILTDFLTKGSYEPAHYNLKVGLITGAHQIKSSGASVAQSVERRTIEVEVRGSKPALGTGGGVGSHLTSLIRRALRRRRPHHSTSGDSKFPLMGLIQLAKKKKVW